jgi:two-component system, NtrC family, response regulator HydG
VMNSEDLVRFLDRHSLKPLLLQWYALSAAIHRDAGHPAVSNRLDMEAHRLFEDLVTHLSSPSQKEPLAHYLIPRFEEIKPPERSPEPKPFDSETVFHEETGMEDRRKLLLLLEVTRAINTERTLEDLLHTIVDRAIELTESNRGFCYLKATSRDTEILIHRNIDRKDIFGENSRISSSVMKKVLDTGRPVHIRDSLTDEEFKSQQSILAWNLRTIMCAPLPHIDLTGQNRTTGTAGVLYVDSTSAGSRFKALEREVFESLAAHAAIGIENIRLRSRLTWENRALKDKVAKTYGVGGIVGTSEPMLDILRMIEKVAPSNANVLILGESGTGKELVARTIHFNGPRAQEAFLSINCAALSETILESELFGVEAGIATGVSRRQGLFVQAHKGTLFLDEVADMSPAMQAKILRVIQERRVRPVGGKQTIDIDVRILCATNKDLWEEVKNGHFREDLLYRLDVISIHIPPLRDRPEDIKLLSKHLMNKHALKLHKEPPGFDSQALALLADYEWPGNVRELENQIERALILADPDRPIVSEDLSPRIRTASGIQPDHAGSLTGTRFSVDLNLPMKTAVDTLESRMILRALELEKGNKVRAAARLGLSREGLRLKLSRLNLKYIPGKKP